MIIGVNAHPLWTTVPPSTWFQPWLKAITGHVKLLRFDVNWQTYSPAFVADLLAMLGSVKITPLVMLGSGGPSWHAPDPWEYATAAAKLAATLPDGAYLEVWNEPNIVPNFMPTRDPAAYARLVWITSMMVKQAAPRVQVVAGVIAFNDGVYLNAFLTASPAPVFDMLSIHPYCPNQSPDQQTNVAQSCVLAMKMAQATGKRWMVSELGFSTTTGAPAVYSPVTDGASANSYRAATALAQAAGAEAFCGYHLGDRAQQGEGDEMSLLNQDQSPRLSWYGLTGALP